MTPDRIHIMRGLWCEAEGKLLIRGPRAGGHKGTPGILTYARDTNIRQGY